MTRRSILVLGGSGFVGGAVVAEALARGDAVTTFNRGRSARRPGPAGVRELRGDRLDPTTLAPLADGEWDLVIDTWSGAPAAVRDCVAVLRDRAANYVYVSSGSVYPPPVAVGVDERSATVDGAPDDPDSSDYARAKRGGELAAQAAFGERALCARCGLILGPGEDIGRLVWWLARMARGGDVLAPAPADRPLSLIDARDLAVFLLDAPGRGGHGPINVVSRRGHTTTGELLEVCRRVTAGTGDRAARLCWTQPAVIEACGIEPWTELPIWLPLGTEFEGMHGMSVERAHAVGLHCRPVAETVADTWAWMQALGGRPPLRDGVPAPGLDPEREREALAAASAD